VLKTIGLLTSFSLTLFRSTHFKMSETPPSPSSSTSSFLPTTTLLAIPDGPIPSSSKDARTHTISILGGYPTFPSLPASSSSKIPESITCKICLNSIPLLTQVYCPPEGGENDRNVYVFGCPRGSCQKREGRCVLLSFDSFPPSSHPSLCLYFSPSCSFCIPFKLYIRMLIRFPRSFFLPCCFCTSGHSRFKSTFLVE
jgi:hypothetical protein